MTEEKVRQQTQTIWEAYASFTGDEGMPDIAQFLLVRKAAVEELSRESNPSPRTTKKTAKPMHAAPSGHTEEKKEKSKVLKKEKPQAEPVKAPYESAGAEKTILPVLQEMPEHQQEEVSDFDILKGLKDPWN